MKNAVCSRMYHDHDQIPAEEDEPYLPTPEHSAAAGQASYNWFLEQMQREQEEKLVQIQWEKDQRKARVLLLEPERLYNKQVHDNICAERERLGIVISDDSSEVGSGTEDDIETDVSDEWM